MKNTHKLYAAGGGLLIAAMMGFAPSFADDGTQTALEADPAIEVAGATAADNDITVAGSEAVTEENAKAQDAQAEPSATEEATSEKPAEAAEPAPQESTSADETAAAGTSEPAQEQTTPAKDDAAAEEAAPAKEVEAAESAPAQVVPVTYVVPHYSAMDADAAPVAEPDPQAPAPLLTMAKTDNNPQSDPNSQRQVAWFELPEPAGPALVPGQSTPLLNAAVSEAPAVNANVVPATAVQTSAVQAAPAQQGQMNRAQTVAEAGTLSRSLARTGSIAQYAALLSVAALIAGAGLLAGAVATTRRRANAIEK
ncbi:hypothetical protein [Mobiluncus curtisii]|uniref:hypothetical protein n=1 Tax=Mobiluncus curtisii TaxID=2051 RepID=UPI00242CF5FF|nr:hypothetical protein [Mobiluncus curtisii]